MPFSTLAMPREPELREGLRIALLSKSFRKRVHASSASSAKKEIGLGALPFLKASRIRCLLVACIACFLDTPARPSSSLIRPITFIDTSEQGCITPSICSSLAIKSISSSEVILAHIALSAY